MQGAKETAKAILRTDGVSGLYRGFGTVVFGAIPARIVSASAAVTVTLHCFLTVPVKPLAMSLSSLPDVMLAI